MYDGADSWSGPAPQQLLSKALNAIPGAKITHSTSSISVADGTADGAGSSPTAAAEGKDEDEPPPSQTFTFAMEVSALGSGFAVEGTAATAAGAREAVALAALHKYALPPRRSMHATLERSQRTALSPCRALQIHTYPTRSS